MGATMQEAGTSVVQTRRSLALDSRSLNQWGPQVASLVQEAYVVARLGEAAEGKQRSADIMKLYREATHAVDAAHRALGAVLLIVKETSDKVNEAEARQKHAAATYRV